jgi:hypothetical protein
MSKLIFKDSEVSQLLCESFYFDDGVLLREVSDINKTNVTSYEYTYEIKEDRVTLTDRYDVYTQDLDEDSEQRLRAALIILNQ